MLRLTLTLLTLLAAPALANDCAQPWKSDHDRARAARLADRILPLAEVQARALAAHPGHVIGIEFEDDDHGPIYEMVILSADGRVTEVEIDAATGALLESEPKDEAKPRKETPCAP